MKIGITCGPRFFGDVDKERYLILEGSSGSQLNLNLDLMREELSVVFFGREAGKKGIVKRVAAINVADIRDKSAKLFLDHNFSLSSSLEGVRGVLMMNINKLILRFMLGKFLISPLPEHLQREFDLLASVITKWFEKNIAQQQVSSSSEDDDCSSYTYSSSD